MTPSDAKDKERHEHEAEKRKATVTKVSISLVALVAALFHSAAPDRSDAIWLALIGIGSLPWLAEIIRSAEFPGGFKVEFQRVKTKVARQAEELETIGYLVTNLITEPEVKYLRKISEGNEYVFKYETYEKDYFFGLSLRKFRGLGFIENIDTKGVDGFWKDKENENRDVCKYFKITTNGLRYLALRPLWEKVERPD